MMRFFVMLLALGISALCPVALKPQDVASDFESLKNQLSDSSLPLVNITVDLDNVSRESYTNASIEIVDPLMRTDGNVSTMLSCKVKYRGTYSSYLNKKSFAVKLLDDDGESLDASILGIRKDDAWILDAMAVDRIRMRNRVNFDVWNAMSRTPYETKYDNRNGTLGFFVEVFINEAYQGLYCMTDKINRKLLNLDKAKTDSNGNPIINGVLYKCEIWGDAAYFAGYDDSPMTEEVWNGWELQYPDDYPCEQAYTPLKEFIDFCSTSTDSELVAQLDNEIYVQNLIDYHVFVLSQGLTDNAMKNTFLSAMNVNNSESADKIYMITPWDLDASLGSAWDGDYMYDKVSNVRLMRVILYSRLWKMPDCDYANKVADRWRELRQTVLADDAIANRLDEYAIQLIESGAWARERKKWKGNPVALKEDLFEELDYVKQWYSDNATILDERIFNGLGSSESVIGDTTSKLIADAIYNVVGQRVTDSYKGFVIKNGKKYIQR